ncbi:hypothetical protein ACJ8QF_23990 [Serratia sp. CY81684]|uniref:hypothetical protein n=1 Tax=Serratia sp. CY81684 TaxID=3383686 RepID=UPI003F9EEBDD
MKTSIKIIGAIAISACSLLAHAGELPENRAFGYVTSINVKQGDYNDLAQVFVTTSTGNTIECNERVSGNNRSPNFIEVAKLSMIFHYNVSTPYNEQCNLKVAI